VGWYFDVIPTNGVTCETKACEGPGSVLGRKNGPRGG